MTIYTSNALRPVAGNQYVPDSMEARGMIKPIPPTNGVRNGAGLLQVSGLWAWEWLFKSMTRVEYQWWADLVGYVNFNTVPVFSKTFNNIGSGGTFMPAARLWLLDTKVTDFDSCVIDVPTWQSYQNGRYHEVTVRFSYMQL